jgi:hypothetical protein
MNKNQTGSVGYKKPPLGTRFKPSKSGNPKGRPKGARNFKSDLRDELHQLIPVRDGDGEHKISKQRAFIRALVGAALEGDMRAAAILSTLCVRVFAGEAEETAKADVSPDDRQILEAFIVRELKRRPDGAGAEEDLTAAPNDGVDDGHGS